jgi:hypothetical protein
MSRSSFQHPPAPQDHGSVTISWVVHCGVGILESRESAQVILTSHSGLQLSPSPRVFPRQLVLHPLISMQRTSR